MDPWDWELGRYSLGDCRLFSSWIGSIENRLCLVCHDMEIELSGEVVGEKSRFEVEVGQGGKSKNSFPAILFTLQVQIFTQDKREIEVC